MTRRARAAVRVAATAVIVALGCRGPSVDETAAVVAEGPVVATSPALWSDAEIAVRGAGTVRPRAEVVVAAEVGGEVVWVNRAFRSGGRVEAGEVLFRIDGADFRNRVRQARAEVARQQVALLLAEEEVTVARAEYRLFAERHPEAAAGKATPLATRVPQLSGARAGLARDSAVLAGAELDLARTAVVAPFDGIVRHESVAIGQVVAPGQGVGSVYASDFVEVVVPVSDAEAALLPELWRLRPGDDGRRPAATVRANSNSDRAWRGYVDRAEAALDAETRTIDVVLKVPDPFSATPPLLVGQFVEVEMAGTAPEGYFSVPRAALRPGNEVWALRPDTTIAIVAVEVVQRTESAAHVTGALSPGQPVVVAGIDLATNGMAVRMEEPGSG